MDITHAHATTITVRAVKPKDIEEILGIDRKAIGGQQAITYRRDSETDLGKKPKAKRLEV